MLKTNIYLHKYVIDSLKQFGELNEVINRVIDAGMEGKFDIEDLPIAPLRTPGDCSQLTVIVHNQSYCELVAMHGARSQTVSLRRILYHFVDNELYVDLGWSVQKQDDYNNSLFKNKLAIVIHDCSKLYKIAPVRYKDCCMSILKLLKEINDGT